MTTVTCVHLLCYIRTIVWSSGLSSLLSADLLALSVLFLHLMRHSRSTWWSWCTL